MNSAERQMRLHLAQMAADDPGGEILVTTYATAADHAAVCGPGADWRAYRDRHDLLKRLAKEYGLSILKARVNPDAYAAWLGPRRNTPDTVAEYAHHVRPPYRLVATLAHPERRAGTPYALGWAMIDLTRRKA